MEWMIDHGERKKHLIPSCQIYPRIVSPLFVFSNATTKYQRRMNNVHQRPTLSRSIVGIHIRKSRATFTLSTKTLASG